MATDNEIYYGDRTFKVYNRCRYDIGVYLLSGRDIIVRAGSFQMMTANDILYIESNRTRDKYFSSKQLVAVDEKGNDIALDRFGVAPDPAEPVHMTDAEIEAAFKYPAKKFEAWIDGINQKTEIFCVYEVMKKHPELPMSKVKLIEAKVPVGILDKEE